MYFAQEKRKRVRVEDPLQVGLLGTVAIESRNASTTSEKHSKLEHHNMFTRKEPSIFR